MDRAAERVCPDSPDAQAAFSSWIERFAQSHRRNVELDAELVIGEAMARQRRRGVPQSDDLVVLDVGSNVGLFTAALAEKGSKIGVRTIGHLFEPSWELHHEGKRRLSSVEGARLYHHNFALSDGKRSAWLAKNRKDNPGWNGLAEEHDPLTPVREGKGWMAWNGLSSRTMVTGEVKWLMVWDGLSSRSLAEGYAKG